MSANKYSFEFFPPRTEEAASRLRDTWNRLAPLGPDYFSVTFGAGGGTRERTLETALAIRHDTGIEGVPHISCTGVDIPELEATLERYRAAGVRHVVALRGDLPSGSIGRGSLQHASELVQLIRRTTGDWFNIEVACYPEFHPQAKSASADLVNFQCKVDAGANSALTQYFYNPDAYFRFLDSCAGLGIGIPIVPGVMPIINSTQLIRFSEACGAEIPRWIMKRLQEFGDDIQAIRAFGADVTTALCERLLAGGAPGLHLYTMNRFEAAQQIWRNLGLPRR